MTQSQPLIFAHRGASFERPEMSREAYLLAVEQGADGFECDLRLTKDRVLVCWHDQSMKRVADCDLLISDSTLAELKAAYPIITLEELLDIALEHGKDLALETKHPVPSHGAVEAELLKTLATYKARIEEAGIFVSIMSFSWFAVARLRRSGWNTVYLVPHLWLAKISPGLSIGPDVGAIKKLNRSRLRHQKLFVWTANTAEEIALCKTKGVDVMMTDRPAFARTILESA